MVTKVTIETLCQFQFWSWPYGPRSKLKFIKTCQFSLFLHRVSMVNFNFDLGPPGQDQNWKLKKSSPKVWKVTFLFMDLVISNFFVGPSGQQKNWIWGLHYWHSALQHLVNNIFEQGPSGLVQKYCCTCTWCCRGLKPPTTPLYLGSIETFWKWCCRGLTPPTTPLWVL